MTSSLMNGTMALTHASSDQFTKREAAQENLYIHEKEREKYVFIFSSFFLSFFLSFFFFFFQAVSIGPVRNSPVASNC